MFQNNFERLNVFSNSELEQINSDECIAPLNVYGSINCNKSIKIGFSDKPIEGSLIYDGSNFLGYHKNGWNLISTNKSYVFLDDEDMFIDKDKNLNLNIRIEDDTLMKYFINENINNQINLILNLNEYHKINEMKFLLKNNNEQDYQLNLVSKPNQNIYLEKNKNNIILKSQSIIIFNIQVDDDDFIISHQEFLK